MIEFVIEHWQRFVKFIQKEIRVLFFGKCYIMSPEEYSHLFDRISNEAVELTNKYEDAIIRLGQKYEQKTLELSDKCTRIQDELSEMIKENKDLNADNAYKKNYIEELLKTINKLDQAKTIFIEEMLKKDLLYYFEDDFTEKLRYIKLTVEEIAADSQFVLQTKEPKEMTHYMRRQLERVKSCANEEKKSYKYRKPESKKFKAKPVEGYVYFIQDDHLPIRTKIGCCVNIENRLKQFSNWPFRPRIVRLIYCKDMFNVEAFFHYYFQNYRLRGEWFNLNNEDLTHVDVHAQYFDMVNCLGRVA